MEPENQPSASLPQADESITKPRKMNLTDEERQRRSERMKALAKTRNDLLRAQKAQRFQEKESMPEPTQEPEPTPEPKPLKAKATPKEEPIVREKVSKKKEPIAKVEKVSRETKPSAKRGRKMIVVESSSESEDYGDSQTDSESEEEEVIYVAKRSTKSKDNKLTKMKKPIRQPNAITERCSSIT